ncbi:MAG: homoserine dehydrogenase [Vampirovibrionales bacterium]|nr:homoserine dehydrogenase [Vampirovibrionales bacterium]
MSHPLPSHNLQEQNAQAASYNACPSQQATDRQTVNIGLLGLGTVGSGIYKILSRFPSYHVPQIAVQNLSKARSIQNFDESLLTLDPLSVVNNPDVDIVVEVMGGVGAAKDAVFGALQNKKHVVTANKELIAKYGPELFSLAKKHNVRLLFEGAVAGGIPVIMPLKLSLAGNRIEEIAGILNGTTNFILTHMTQQGADYADVLKQAQELGFAEADPTSDVEGFDTAYKISILSSLAFHQEIPTAKVHREGITQITADDIKYADELGYIIKLLGIARRIGEGGASESPDAVDVRPGSHDAVDVRVHPVLIPKRHPLANIHFEYNALWIKGDAVGDVMFYGKGAGEMPTASAAMGDILAIGSELLRGNDPVPLMDVDLQGEANLLPITGTENRYYLRVRTKDVPGVIGQVGTVFGEYGVSLESVLQKGVQAESPTNDACATIVLMTHAVNEGKLQQAVKKMSQLPSIDKIACLLRVFG